jgi:hypothetical protein
MAPSAVHDLKTLVLSRHPGILIETQEPERAEALVQAVAADLRIGRFEWSVTAGLRRAGDTGGVYQTTDPARALAAIAELEVEAIFELHDFSPYLEKPELSRAFRDLLDRLSSPARLSTVVLIDARAGLPPEIEPRVMRYDLRFPSRDEYRHAIAAVIESLRLNGRAAVELDSSDYDEFCAALSGLTLNQARQAVARAAIVDGRLHRDDLARLAETKRARSGRTACSSTSRPRTTASRSAASRTCGAGSSGRASASAARPRSSASSRQRACCWLGCRAAASRSPRRRSPATGACRS